MQITRRARTLPGFIASLSADYSAGIIAEIRHKSNTPFAPPNVVLSPLDHSARRGFIQGCGKRRRCFYPARRTATHLACDLYRVSRRGFIRGRANRQSVSPHGTTRQTETESQHTYDGACDWDARRDETAAVFASPELAAEITRRNHKRTEYSVRP